MKKWLRKNGIDLILGIGLTLFLVNFFTEQDEGVYVISLPLIVYSGIMLYRRHFRHPTNSANDFFASTFDDDDDELYEDAKEAVIDAGKASTSYLQRKLRVGYSRAARLMDLLEKNNVIGPANGSEPRKVFTSEDKE